MFSFKYSNDNFINKSNKHRNNSRHFLFIILLFVLCLFDLRKCVPMQEAPPDYEPGK
jgi:hypothetical protein